MWLGKVSFGELSIKEMSLRGIICWENCLKGNFLSENCPSGKSQSVFLDDSPRDISPTEFYPREIFPTDSSLDGQFPKRKFPQIDISPIENSPDDIKDSAMSCVKGRETASSVRKSEMFLLISIFKEIWTIKSLRFKYFTRILILDSSKISNSYSKS